MGGLTIASGAPGFLVVALNVLGHVQVRHKAHVGLVDAHAKRNRGHHHQAFFTQETVLVALAHGPVQACVVGQRGNAGVTQEFGDLFHAAA